MTYTFTRQELYDLVWSKPMRDIAKDHSISDRGLAKACDKANIPVPERGYWNKLQAGQKPGKRLLSSRGLGQSNIVHIGGKHWDNSYVRRDPLNDPLPPEPVFDVNIETIRTDVVKMVQAERFPKSLNDPHRLIAKLLQEDDIRRQKSLASSYSWEQPIFDNAFERRRFKILNSLFTLLERCGIKLSVHDKQGRDLRVTVGDQSLSFTLDSLKAAKQLERERSGYSFVPRDPKDGLELTISSWRLSSDTKKSWQDIKEDKIEDHIREIAVELIVSGEISYRQGEIQSYKWAVERKIEAEENERKRIAEIKRKERERQEKLAQERIDHLLGQATALRQANEIRTLVETFRQANSSSPTPLSQQEFNDWEKWAIEQADQLDPVKSGKFKTRPTGEC